MLKTFEVYWGDLTPEAQGRLFDFLGGENGNYDFFPFATLEIEDEVEETCGSCKYFDGCGTFDREEPCLGYEPKESEVFT